jgi:hypothetical protein
MVSLSVRLLGERLIADQGEADQASAGSAGFVLDCDLAGSKSHARFSQIGTAAMGARQLKNKAIKNQGKSKTPPMGNEDGVSEGGSMRR